MVFSSVATNVMHGLSIATINFCGAAWLLFNLTSFYKCFTRGGSRGVHREQAHPPLKKIVQEDRDTLIEQSL